MGIHAHFLTRRVEQSNLLKRSQRWNSTYYLPRTCLYPLAQIHSSNILRTFQTLTALHFYSKPPIKCYLDTDELTTYELRRRVTLPGLKNAPFESLTITDMTVTGFDKRTARSCGEISMIMHVPKTDSAAGLDSIIFLSGEVKVTSLTGMKLVMSP